MKHFRDLVTSRNLLKVVTMSFSWQLESVLLCLWPIGMFRYILLWRRICELQLALCTSRDSWVSKWLATGWKTRVRIPAGEKIPLPPQSHLLRSHPALYPTGSRNFPSGKKRPEREAYDLPSYTTEFKNEWLFTPSPTCVFDCAVLSTLKPLRCTTRFNVVKLCILPTQCTCVFRMVLTINSDCFPKQH
jgi:hypothetical protein